MNLFNQFINEFAFINDLIREFHHWWWALKSSHIIKFLINSIVMSFFSIVYSFEFVFWHFFLYTLKIEKLSIFVLKTFDIWIFVSKHKSDRDVIKYRNDFNTNIIILCFWFSFCLDKILLKTECDIVIWFDSIHDSYIQMMSILFSKLYFKHDIIVFVNLAQLCCKNLISWVFVLVIKRVYCIFRLDFNRTKVLTFWVNRCMCLITVCTFRRLMRTWFF